MSLYRTEPQDLASNVPFIWTNEAAATDQTNDFDLIADLPLTTTIVIRRPGRYALTYGFIRVAGAPPLDAAAFLESVEIPGTRVRARDLDTDYVTLQAFIDVLLPDQSLQIRNAGIIPSSIGFEPPVVGAFLTLLRIGAAAPAP